MSQSAIILFLCLLRQGTQFFSLPEFSCILILTFIFKAGQAKDFLEPLLEAKKAGLKLALHLSEVNNIVKLGWRG